MHIEQKIFVYIHYIIVLYYIRLDYEKNIS